MRLRRCFVVSRDRSILLSYVLLRGTFLWSFRALRGLRMSLCGRVRSVFWPRKCSSYWPIASAKRIGELHALSYRVSHTRDWGEVSFAFVTGFVAKTQDSSSLAPRFEGFTVPALPNARKNRIGRLLCPVRAVKVYLDRNASHRPHVNGCLSPRGVARRRLRRPRSPSGSGRKYHALTSSLERHCQCPPPELVRHVVSLRQFFSKRILLSTRC